MKNEEIINAIESEIDYCEQTSIDSNPSYVKTEMARLDLIDKYMLSQYRDSNTDSFGNQMVFYNISSLPVEVAAKMLDFDTKDIKFMSTNDKYWETWLMEKELKFWMEEKYFGKNLNEFAYRYPRDGHLVVKKIDNDVKVVPLKNLRFRPDCLSFEETPIIEKFSYQYDQFVSEAKKRGWSNWQQVTKQENVTKSGGSQKTGEGVTVFEAWFPENYLDLSDNWFLISHDGVLLASGFFAKSSYKGLAWDKIDNRLLGRGQVEKLFNEQIYLNRIGNYKAEALHWSSKRLFYTRDNTVNSNLLGYSDNGDVFIVNDDIKQVPVEERNLSFYNYEEGRWEKHSNDRTFATESVTGQRPHSGTAYRSSLLEAQMTQGYYDQKKENLGMFVKEILWDWIIPEFKKENRKEHSVIMRNILESGGGSEKYFEMHLNAMLNRERMYKPMTPEVEQIRKAFLTERLKNKKITIPKGIYDNLEYKMTIVIDNENIDTAGKLQTFQLLMQMVNNNPAILQNKITRNILFKTLNIAGFNPMDFEFQEEQQSVPQASETAQMMRGGSLAGPNKTQTMQQLPVKTSL